MSRPPEKPKGAEPVNWLSKLGFKVVLAPRLPVGVIVLLSGPTANRTD